VYDFENKQTRVLPADGTRFTSTYDGDTKRVKTEDAGVKKQVWDGENILIETDGNDVTAAAYYLEPALRLPADGYHRPCRRPSTS
jgi:hypothetical protein